MRDVKKLGQVLDVLGRGPCLAVEQRSNSNLLTAELLCNRLESQILLLLGFEERRRRSWELVDKRGLLQSVPRSNQGRVDRTSRVAMWTSFEGVDEDILEDCWKVRMKVAGRVALAAMGTSARVDSLVDRATVEGNILTTRVEEMYIWLVRPGT